MPERPREQLLDLPEGDPLSTEHLDEKVQQAEAQELLLKRQLEVIERQRRELEELTRRQESFNAGKSDMVDKITRAIVVLERETFEASKRVELLQTIHANFHAHLENLEAINPKAWEGLDIHKELTKALAAVEDARSEYNKSFPKINALPDLTAPNNPEPGYTADSGGGDAKDFLGWLKIGLAFSLPLLVFGLITLIVILSRLN